MSIYTRSLLFTLAAVLVVNAVAYAFLIAHLPPGPPRPPGPPMQMGPEQRPGGLGGLNEPDVLEGPNGPGGPDGPPGGSFSGISVTRGLMALTIEIVVLLPLALLFAHSLSAPLRRLAEAARQGGQGPSFAALPREGPEEVRLALDCFNTMQARLNKLVQERTHMVGAIAHDLRTPLTRLAFRLDDLAPPLGDKVRADIEEMKAMISAALDFIRERSVRGPLERLDFRSIVERVVDEQSDLGHDVQLEPGAPLTLEGDPMALRRMVANLVENALKYGLRARLRLSTEGNHCLLQVKDDGPGIPEALQSQVFDPFFRIEASRNRQTGGIGLGLTAVRAIVIEHNGEVQLANRREGGLNVTVRLPLPTA